jgi:hypothetical protein
MDVWVNTHRYIETKGQTLGLEVTTVSLQVDIHLESSSAYLVSEQDEVLLLWPLPFLRMVEMVKRVLIFGICTNLNVVLESLAPPSPSFQPMSCQSALLAPSLLGKGDPQDFLASVQHAYGVLIQRE